MKPELEAVFIGFNAALAVRFPPFFVGIFLLAFLASGENTSSISENLPRQFGIIPYEHNFLEKQKMRIKEKFSEEMDKYYEELSSGLESRTIQTPIKVKKAN